MLVRSGTILLATNVDHAIRRGSQVHHIQYDHLEWTGKCHSLMTWFTSWTVTNKLPISSHWMLCVGTTWLHCRIVLSKMSNLKHTIFTFSQATHQAQHGGHYTVLRLSTNITFPIARAKLECFLYWPLHIFGLKEAIIQWHKSRDTDFCLARGHAFCVNRNANNSRGGRRMWDVSVGNLSLWTWDVSIRFILRPEVIYRSSFATPNSFSLFLKWGSMSWKDLVHVWHVNNHV